MDKGGSPLQVISLEFFPIVLCIQFQEISAWWDSDSRFLPWWDTKSPNSFGGTSFGGDGCQSVCGLPDLCLAWYEGGESKGVCNYQVKWDFWSLMNVVPCMWGPIKQKSPNSWFAENLNPYQNAVICVTLLHQNLFTKLNLFPKPKLFNKSKPFHPMTITQKYC